MKILETTVEGLNSIKIVNKVLQLSIAGKLYTDKLNPMNHSAPVWGPDDRGVRKAVFTITTNVGAVTVQATALEWQVSQESGGSLVQRAVETVGGYANAAKNFIIGGCAGCSK